MTDADDADVPTSVDFRDPAHVAKWLETAESVRPWRPQIRQFIAELVRDEAANPCSVLELGPGAGLLAEAILETCTISRYTLVDFSRTFLQLCIERLGDDSPAHAVVADFTQPDWSRDLSPPYDAVVIMQAVHELRHKRRAVTLYAQLRPLLRPGGLLVVCDHMPKDDARTRALHATNVEQLVAMNAAGFVDAATRMLEHGMYICSARSPAT